MQKFKNKIFPLSTAVTSEIQKFIDDLIRVTGIEPYRDLDTICPFCTGDGDFIDFLAGFYVTDVYLTIRTRQADLNILDHIS